MTTVRLHNGVTMPRLGLGTWPMDDVEAERAVTEALARGYRLVDTAHAYANEAGVGRALRASGLPREDVFVVSKLNAEWHGVREAHEAFAMSASRLGLEYIDLFLIHWPNPAQDRYIAAWEGLLELLEAGRVHAIGTSNFKPAHVRRLVDATGVAPHVNQIELHPYLVRFEQREFHAQHAIITQAWAPLGRGGQLLADPVITTIAARHARTPAQVVLRWHIEAGVAPIPKSARPQRLDENRAIFDFALAPDELDAISALDRGEGVATHDADRFGH
jgi:2,5-diketo-D-gluconate reductase A